jgi:hypothetical protein
MVLKLYPIFFPYPDFHLVFLLTPSLLSVNFNIELIKVGIVPNLPL